MITIKSKKEIEHMKKAGRLAAECLKEMGKLVKENVTPLEIDKACYDWTIAKGAIPAPLNYRGFPNSICVSVNDVVCHGIPDDRPLQNGDIVNLDVTPKLNGYHGDTSATFIVGQVPDKVGELVYHAKEALWRAIEIVAPGVSLGDIGYTIQSYVESKQYSVVTDYCGHGIGTNFHEDPMVLHVGRPGHGLKLKEGMTFTIEPMINMGKKETYVEKDNWTVRTVDGSLSAQFEHTLLVTSDGFKVLTSLDDESQ